VWRWLVQVFGGLRRGTRNAARGVRDLLARQLAARRERLLPDIPHFFSFRRMSPQERVRYYYISILHRSRKQGFGRPPSVTPLEYEHTLRERMPEMSEDVRELTQAFLEARYSEHDLRQEDEQRVQPFWKRIKRWFAQHRRMMRRSKTESDAG
jgi:hypothetical protein